MQSLCAVLNIFMRASFCEPTTTTISPPPVIYAPLTTTPYGILQGRNYVADDGDTIDVFQGVPYTQPLTPSQRLKPALPLDPWAGTRLAVRPAPKCMTSPPSSEMAEDCLYMDIHTPSKRDQSLPVLVFLDSLDPSFGSLEWEAVSLLASRGIVVVRVQYRMGALGYLSLGNGSSAIGNLAHRDQLMALHFISTVISSFGGDPARVTVMDVDDSSATVLAASPLSDGLFSSSIQLGGSSPIGHAPSASVIKSSKELLDRIGCQRDDDDERQHDVIGCLQSTDVADVIEAESGLRFGTVLDGDVIPRPTSQLWQSAKATSTLIGMAVSEYATARPVTRSFAEKYIRTEIAPVFPEKTREEAYRRIADHYLGNAIGDGEYYSRQMEQLVSHINRQMAQLREARERSKMSPVFLFVMDYPTDLLNSPEVMELVDAIVAFVQHQNPSTDGLRWPPFSDNMSYAKLNDNSSIGIGLMEDDLLFWDGMSNLGYDIISGETTPIDPALTRGTRYPAISTIILLVAIMLLI